MTPGQTLVRQFEPMVRRDGGALSLLTEDEALIRIGYRQGRPAECESGTCILPHVELQGLINETLARRAAVARVEVVPIGA
jgi:Fe-S cluster biogenesis protein NfuA